MPELSWHPRYSLTAEDFLRRHLREEDTLHLRLLVWPPAEKRYPKITAQLLKTAAAVVSELATGLATTAAWGPRWIQNAAYHAEALSRREGSNWGRLILGKTPLIIAASGPTLEDSVAGLATIEGTVEIWSLPSAVKPLVSAGITPNLVVASDAGFYARSHLRPAYRLGIPVAAPLTAARNLHRLPGRVVPFSTGSSLEGLILGSPGAEDPSIPRVPENGSVAGLALDLALSLGREPVVFLGLDGCSRDIRSHARPSELEPYITGTSGRLRPAESCHYERVAESSRVERVDPPQRISTALAHYSAWFARRCAPLGRKVRRIAPTFVDFGMGTTSLEDVAKLLQQESAQTDAHPQEELGVGRRHVAWQNGYRRLLRTLDKMVGPGLEGLLSEEHARRVRGLPRSEAADLLFLAAPRPYLKALTSDDSHQAVTEVREAVTGLSRTVARYAGPGGTG